MLLTGQNALQCGHSAEAKEETLFAVTEDYPGPYPAGLQCEWAISAPDGHTIQIAFIHWEIERMYETFRIGKTLFYPMWFLGRYH